MQDFDAIAIGGGLAGAAFALELARRGRRVAVIERTAVPTLKVCGDFLSAEARELLAYLGLDISVLGATRITTLRLVSAARAASVELPFAAAGLSRLALDEALLADAQRAGAEVMRGEATTALRPMRGAVEVSLGGRTLRAASVALATGKHNLRGFPRRAGSMTAFKVQLVPTAAAARALDGVVQLAGYRGGYIGACNAEDGNATICWLMDERCMRALGGDWRGQLAYIARSCPAVGDLIAGARFVSERPTAIAAIPYGYTRRAAIAENVFALGDQLAVIPSFTGDGTSLALSSGVGAAQAVLAGRSAAEFQRAFIARIRAQLLWARVVDAAFKSAPTRTLGIAVVAAVPALAGALARLTRLKGVGELIAAPPLRAPAP
jgi:flavin-dependent dehydrogenase